jgi:hypothetical protein
MNALIGWILPRAWRRGVRGGSRAWMAAGAAALVARVLLKAIERTEEVVYREELPAGHHLVIEHQAR